MFMRYSEKQIIKKEDIDWKNFYRQVLALVVPIAVQNLINVGVQASDVIMLGKVGEKVLSGASLAGQVQFIMTLIFFGITSGATVLTAQYWGKGDTKTIEKILGMGLTGGLITAILFFGAAMAIPETLMHIFTSDESVIKEGVQYLRIVSVAYIFMAVTQVYLNIVRSIERVIISTVVYSISLLTNIVINAILIFGLCGFRPMGIRGAAIGTLAARAVEMLIVIWYAKFRNQDVKVRLSYMWNMNPVLFRDFLKFSLPVVMNELMWGLGTSANTAIIGHLGSAAVAANSVAQVARQLAMVIVFGISHATAIYLGKTIGSGRYEEAKIYARKFILLAFLFSAAGSVLLLFSGPVANANLALTKEAQGYLTFMFWVMAYFVIAQAVNATMVVGIFRSGGDTRFGLFLDVGTMWGCSILLGWAAAFVFHAPVRIVYAILLCDELIKLPITVKRFVSYKWLKNVTRELQNDR